MKKRILSFMMLICLTLTGLWAQKTTPYFTKVSDFRPAPGQTANEKYPVYYEGDTRETMIARVDSILKDTLNSMALISLGAFGGYAEFYFQEAIVNKNSDDYDFSTFGNAFTGSSEPGIVMVAFDANNNGVRDENEPWYELAGSEYQKSIHHYRITYYQPDTLAANVPWRDNLGQTGVIPRNNFHRQLSYYPVWLTGEDGLPLDSLVFQGTRFPDSLLKKSGQWGYTDNVPNGQTGGNFKISWAVGDDGAPVFLPAVHFIKIYSAANKIESPALGEVSTEIKSPAIRDLHPELVYTPPVDTNRLPNDSVVLNPNKQYFVLSMQDMLSTPESIWAETLTYSDDEISDPEGLGINQKTFEKNPFVFHYASVYDGASWEGFTYSNKTDDTTAGYLNEFSAITQGGVDGVGSPYVVAYYSEFSAMLPEYGYGNNHLLSFTGGKNRTLVGTYITNSTFAYLSMLNGDATAKRFGGKDGRDKDWFKVIFTGMDEKGDTTGQVEYYLADFRSDNLEEHYIVNNWRWVDLSMLGKVSTVTFAMATSDVNQYRFMNTPTYFCLDKLMAEAADNHLAWLKIDGDDLENFHTDTLLYQIALPEETTVMPVVTAGMVDSLASLEIIQANMEQQTTRVKVTSDNGNERMYTLVFKIDTVIPQPVRMTTQVQEFHAYPNPTTGSVTILNPANLPCKIQLFDLTGKLLFETNQTTFNISSFPAGMYILSVNEQRFKIVKE